MSEAVTIVNMSAQYHSPCVRNCCLDGNKVCVGCGRSLAEILEWHHADHFRQQQISAAAKQRLSEKAQRATLY